MSEGLRTLAEHLARVKSQSEMAIQSLGEKTKALECENDALRRQLQACLDELDFKNGQVRAQAQLLSLSERAELRP